VGILGLTVICHSASQAIKIPAAQDMAETTGSTASVCKNAAPAAKPIIANLIVTPPVRRSCIGAFGQPARPTQRYYASSIPAIDVVAAIFDPNQYKAFYRYTLEL
jgi:hypothetical protein